MRHDYGMNFRRVLDARLSIEFLKIHVRVGKHSQRQPQRLNRMLINADGDDQCVRSNPRKVRRAAEEWARVDQNLFRLRVFDALINPKTV